MIKANLTCKAASRDAVASCTRNRLLLAGFAVALSLGLALSPQSALADEAPAEDPAAAPAEAGDHDGHGSDAAFGHAVAALTATVVNEQSAQEMDAYTAHLEATAAEAVRASKVDAVLAEALSHKGAPYAYGGTTPRGFDCSGFTSYVFRTALGVELPRTAAAQAGVGESVSMDALLPGDLLFWGRGSGVYHVAVYVGDGSYIHAAGSGKGVRVQTMEYFHPTFAKRLI